MKVHDFADKELGKVAPYGVYDIAADAGWISLGITHDTAAFAVASIRTWLEKIGRARYPNMRELTSRPHHSGLACRRPGIRRVFDQRRVGRHLSLKHVPLTPRHPDTTATAGNRRCPSRFYQQGRE